MPPVTDRANLYGDAGAGKLSEAVRGALARVYVPEPAVERRLRHRPGDLQGRRPLPRRPQPAARRAVVGPEDALGRQQRREHDQGQPDADRSDDRQAGQGDRGRRPVQHVLHARRQGGDRRRRGVQAARLPRPADDGAEVVAGDAAVRAASTTPTSRSTGASRSSPASSAACWSKIDMVGRKVLGYLKLSTGKMPQDIRVSPDGSDLLRRRHDGRRRVRDRRRELQGDRLRQDRQGHARPVPEPRRQEALRRQPRLEQDPRRRARHGQRLGARLRDPQGRRDLADPRRRQPRHGQRQRRRQVALARRAATTTSSMRSTRRPARSRSSRSAREPHGLTVWPQPGRYSLGHTGNMR